MASNGLPEAFASNELVGERLLIAKPAPPPGLILLKKHAPISQEPQAVFNSQPVFKRATPVRMLGDMVRHFSIPFFVLSSYFNEKRICLGIGFNKMAKTGIILCIHIGVASKRGGRRVGQLYSVARPCPSSTQELPRIFQLQSVTGKFPDLSSSTRHPTFRARRRREHHAHVKAQKSRRRYGKKRPK